MSTLVHNYPGGKTDEYGTQLILNRIMSGDVVEGFAVVPNGTPNMTVLVQPGSGRITTGTYPSSFGYLVSHDTTAGESVTIATAAASPRIDYIVAYIDKSITGSTAVVNNINGVLKFASVAGTPSGSPVVPTTAQIQAAIGAANPYIILARVAVGASVTTITTANITDLRVMATMTSGLASARKTTDANGWTVYDYGSWKKYTKRVTFSQSVSTASAVLSLSSSNLPAGMATLGSNYITGTKTVSGYAYALLWGFEMASGSSVLNITVASSSGTITFSGWIDVEITTP